MNFVPQVAENWVHEHIGALVSLETVCAIVGGYLAPQLAEPRRVAGVVAVQALHRVGGGRGRRSI